MWVSCQVHSQHSHSCYYFQQSHQELRTDPKSSTESRIWHKGHLWFISNNLPIITCFVYLQFEKIRRYVLWTCLSFRSLFLGHLLVLREVFPHSNFLPNGSGWLRRPTGATSASSSSSAPPTTWSSWTVRKLTLTVNPLAGKDPDLSSLVPTTPWTYGRQGGD